MIVTVDIVVLTILDGELGTLLHRRPEDPFKGSWALPGGFVRPEEDETSHASVERILRAKAGIDGIYFEQLATYSGSKRDPRDWSLSIAHIALVQSSALRFGEGSDVGIFPIKDIPDLPFDHEEILSDALGRLRGKGSYSTLPASLLPESFTFSQMHKVYEISLGEKLDKVSFRRKVMDLDFIEETGESSKEGSRRPAALYRRKGGAQTFNRNLAMSGN